ncbi:MAG: tellurite resistance TerB family protein [Rhodospirillales bacterium]
MPDHHAALVYAMVLASAADCDMSDAELRTIGEIVDFLPVFQDFDRARLTATVADCAALLDNDEGLDTVLGLIYRVLPEHLHETAYALACDVVACDLEAKQEELRLLELMRHALGIDRLSAAAIERGARARFATV